MRAPVIIALVMMVTGFAVAADSSGKAKADTGATAAAAWLAVVDSGEYAKSWAMSSGMFQMQINAEQWTAALDKSRMPLGAMVTRKVKSAKYSTELPGVPDGEYVVVVFNSSFAKKKKAQETVTVTFENGEWKVAGYFIK